MSEIHLDSAPLSTMDNGKRFFIVFWQWKSFSIEKGELSIVFYPALFLEKVHCCFLFRFWVLSPFNVYKFRFRLRKFTAFLSPDLFSNEFHLTFHIYSFIMFVFFFCVNQKYISRKEGIHLCKKRDLTTRFSFRVFVCRGYCWGEKEAFVSCVTCLKVSYSFTFSCLWKFFLKTLKIHRSLKCLMWRLMRLWRDWWNSPHFQRKSHID